MRWRLAWIPLLLALSACGREFPNQPLEKAEANRALVERLTLKERAPEDPMLMMSISGGGVRATAFGLFVMQELRAVRYAASGGRPRRLIDEIGVISAVSGGSVAAAWFGLHGADALDRLEGEFVREHNNRNLLLRAASPVTWARLAGPSFARIDVWREYLDDRLFQGRTIADLYGADRPLIVLNATDMAAGEVFDFTAERFDDICSDLGALPISAALAASSAFPGVLTPLTFRNYSAEGCGVAVRPRPAEPPENRFFDPARYLESQAARDLRGPSRPYLHLLDGGLADNIGGESLRRQVFGLDGSVAIAAGLNDGRIKRLVLILVNARSDPDPDLDRSSATPGLFKVFGAVTGTPIDAASKGTIGGFREAVESYKKSIRTARQAGVLSESLPEKVYFIQVDFDLLDAGDPAQAALQRRVKEIATTWSISERDIADLKAAAATLLRQDPCMRALRRDLGLDRDLPAEFDLCLADLRN